MELLCLGPLFHVNQVSAAAHQGVQALFFVDLKITGWFSNSFLRIELFHIFVLFFSDC